MTTPTREAFAQLDAILAALSADDRARVHAIIAAQDQVTCAALIMAYVRDLDRAERAPRGLLYLFLGMQSAVIETLLVVQHPGPVQ